MSMAITEQKIIPVLPHILFNSLSLYLGCSVKSYGRIIRITERGTFYILRLRNGQSIDDLVTVLPKDVLTPDIVISMYSSIQYEGKVTKDPQDKGIEVHIYKICSYSYFDPADVKIDYKMGEGLLRSHISQRLLHRRYQCIMQMYDMVESTLHEVSKVKGMLKVRAPLITFNDCEGSAGEVFAVKSVVDHFFSKPAYLSVSSQLEEETVTSKFMTPTYTFEHSFRSDKSDTNMHVAEFSHYEPEIPYLTLDELMDWIEDTLSMLSKRLLSNEKFPQYLKILDPEKGIDRVKSLQNKFKRISYTHAIEILQARHKDERFTQAPEWGGDLSKQHERYLCEVHFGRPTFIHSYPSMIKSFYMKQNNEKDTLITCQSCDLLVPGIGELVGGGVREDKYGVLVDIIKQKGLSLDAYKDYLCIRKEGGPPTAGFGLGFDRLIMYIGDITNIRDVCAHPRYYKF